MRARVQADPDSFLAAYSNGVIIDEFQRIPELVSYIQVAVDSKVGKGRFVLTGSQQFEIMNKVTQSLAGRVGILKLLPFSVAELQSAQEGTTSNLNVLLFTGFYPGIYDQHIPAPQGYNDYFATNVQRDVRTLGNVSDLSQFEKFVRLCAGRVGQLLNLQNIAQDLGIAHATAQRWLTILQASYIIHLVQPFHWRTTKRLVKAPKLYFYDVGLAAWLNGVQNAQPLSSHHLRANLFENMVVMEALKFRLNRGLRDNLYFYRDSDGSEIDLVFEFANGIYPIEIKSGATITNDYFEGLRHLAKIFAADSNPLPNGGGLVYGGDDSWPQMGVRVTAYEQMNQLFESCNRSDLEG